jgi:hypothetical protein
MSTRKHQYYRKIPNLLYRANRMIITGIYDKPPWYEALRRIPPVTHTLKPHPGKIQFPEDYLYPKILKKLPELQLEIHDLNNLQEFSLTSKIVKAWYNNIQKLKNSGSNNTANSAQKPISPNEIIQKMLANPAQLELEALDTTIKQLDREIQTFRLSLNTVRGDIMPITANNVNSILKQRFEEMNLLRNQLRRAGAKPRPVQFSTEIEADMNIREQVKGYKPAQYKEDVHVNRNKNVLRYQLQQTMEQEKFENLQEESERDIITDLMRQDPYIKDHQNPTEFELIQYQQFILQRGIGLQYKLALEKAQHTLNHALTNLIIKPEAQLRDWVAYVLRFQILTLNQRQAIDWKSYSAGIDDKLFAQAKAILLCERIEYLTESRPINVKGFDSSKVQSREEGMEAEGEEGSENAKNSTTIANPSASSSSQGNNSVVWSKPRSLQFPFDPSDLNEGGPADLLAKYGLINLNYSIRSEAENSMELSPELLNKHKLLMFYIDLALKRFVPSANAWRWPHHDHPLTLPTTEWQRSSYLQRLEQAKLREILQKKQETSEDSPALRSQLDELIRQQDKQARQGLRRPFVDDLLPNLTAESGESSTLVFQNRVQRKLYEELQPFAEQIAREERERRNLAAEQEKLATLQAELKEKDKEKGSKRKEKLEEKKEAHAAAAEHKEKKE